MAAHFPFAHAARKPLAGLVHVPHVELAVAVLVQLVEEFLGGQVPSGAVNSGQVGGSRANDRQCEGSRANDR